MVMDDANSQSENPMGLSATASELLRGIQSEVVGVSPRPMKKLFDLAKQHQNIDESDLELPGIRDFGLYRILQYDSR